MTISQAHSGTMGQETGEIWTAETLLQPILPTSDRLLESNMTDGYVLGSGGLKQLTIGRHK